MDAISRQLGIKIAVWAGAAIGMVLFGFVAFLNYLSLIATVRDMTSPNNSSVKAAVLFLIAGQWWMYLSSVALCLVALLIIYWVDARYPKNRGGGNAFLSNAGNATVLGSGDGSGQTLYFPVPISQRQEAPDQDSERKAKVAMLARIANDYRTTNLLAKNLETLQEKIVEQFRAEGFPVFCTPTLAAFINAQKAAYVNDLQSEAVRTAHKLRSDYGIIAPGFNDEALLQETLTKESLYPVVQAFMEASSKLKELLTSEASEL
jgi:hypothetical protein